jgi:hypothetical protein
MNGDLHFLGKAQPQLVFCFVAAKQALHPLILPSYLPPEHLAQIGIFSALEPIKY